MIKYFVIFIVILSCKKSDKTTIYEDDIKVRSFYLNNTYSKISSIKVSKIESQKKLTFIYHNNDSNDTLVFINDSIFYNNNLLLKIDSKKINLKNKSVFIDKYFLQNKVGRGFAMNLFVNRKNGLVLSEYMGSGLIKEYNLILNKKIQKLIILRKLGYEPSPYEINYDVLKYPDYEIY